MAAVVGFHDLAADGQEVLWLPQRFQIEIHGAAADQPIAGGDIFVQIVVFELGAAVLPQDLFGREPDVALDTTPTQSPHSTAVLPDQQHGARLLGRGALGPHDGGQNTGLTVFQVVNRTLDNFSHLIPRFNAYNRQISS